MTLDLAKQVAFQTGIQAAKEGTPTTKNGGPMISMSMGRFYNQLLLVTGVIGDEIRESEYMPIMKQLVAQYEEGYLSVPKAEREAAKAKIEAEALAEQKVVDLIQQHFPGSIIVPL